MAFRRSKKYIGPTESTRSSNSKFSQRDPSNTINQLQQRETSRHDAVSNNAVDNENALWKHDGPTVLPIKKLDKVSNSLYNVRGQTKRDAIKSFAGHHKKGLVGFLIGALMVSGLLGTGTMLSGPMQFIHVLNFLQDTKLAIQEGITSARLLKNISTVLRYGGDSRKDILARSRLGVIGNAVASMQEKRLNSRGIQTRTLLGGYKGMTIDMRGFTGNANHTMSMDNQDGIRRAIANTGLDIDDFVHDANGNIELDSNGNLMVRNDLPRSRTRQIINIVDQKIGNRFKIVSAVQTRLLKRRLGLTGWHPLERRMTQLLNDTTDRLGRYISEKATAREKRLADIKRQRLRQQGLSADDLDAGLKEIAEEEADKLLKVGQQRVTSAVGSAVGKIMVVTMVIDIICTINELLTGEDSWRQTVYNNAMDSTIETMSVGSQIMSGDDLAYELIDLEGQHKLYNANIETMEYDNLATDTDGGQGAYVPVDGSAQTVSSSWWAAAPVQAELGNAEAAGDTSNVPAALLAGGGAMSFVPDGLRTVLDATLDNGLVNGVCAAYNFLMSTVLGFITDAVMEALTTAGLDDDLNNLMNSAMGLIYGEVLDIAYATPEMFGSIHSYGGVALSNDTMLSMGATQVSNEQWATLQNEEKQLQNAEYAAKPVWKKLFDTSDYRSGISTLARNANWDTSNQSIGTQLANVAKTVAQAPNLIASSINNMSYQTNAASAVAYDYNMPRFAYDDAELDLLYDENDGAEYNFVENTAWVQDKLENGGVPFGVNDKLKVCFGVEIKSDGQVTTVDNSEGTAYTYDDIINQDCDSIDFHWRTYLLDYMTMASSGALEYEEEEGEHPKLASYLTEACKEIGACFSISGSTDSSNFSDPATVATAFETDTNNTGDYDGVFGRQCVDLSLWFVNKYTALNTASGDGGDLASNIAAANGLSVSSIPQAPAIFSTRSTKFRAAEVYCNDGEICGHTGVILSVNGNTITGIDTWNGASNLTFGAVDKFTIEWDSSDEVDFLYLGNHLK